MFACMQPHKRSLLHCRWGQPACPVWGYNFIGRSFPFLVYMLFIHVNRSDLLALSSLMLLHVHYLQKSKTHVIEYSSIHPPTKTGSGSDGQYCRALTLVQSAAVAKRLWRAALYSRKFPSSKNRVGFNLSRVQQEVSFFDIFSFMFTNRVDHDQLTHVRNAWCSFAWIVCMQPNHEHGDPYDGSATRWYPNVSVRESRTTLHIHVQRRDPIGAVRGLATYLLNGQPNSGLAGLLWIRRVSL
jgi:hypothetical protein